MKRTPHQPLTGADRRWGYTIGVDGWLTVKEAAELTGFTIQYLCKLHRDGKVRKARSQGRSPRYCKRSVVAYIAPIEV
jgi:excisionase family DNA binding protein